MIWKVYYFNGSEFDIYNVFNHTSFNREVQELLQRKSLNKEDFSEELRAISKYYFWGKNEWEILLNPCHYKAEYDVKIDVYSQLNLNWQQFEEYVWNSRANGEQVSSWIPCEQGQMPEDFTSDKSIIDVLVTLSSGVVTKVQRRKYGNRYEWARVLCSPVAWMCLPKKYVKEN